MNASNFSTGSMTTGADTASEHADDLEQLQEGVRIRNQLFESIKIQLIDSIQDSSVQRAISAVEAIVPSHKIEGIAEKANVSLEKGNSDSETIIIATTDIAKRKLDLQHRLTIASEESEVKAITKLLQIVHVAEETFIKIAKALIEKPAMRDLITTKEVVMKFGDEAFQRMRPFLNDKLVTIPLYASDKAPVVDGQHRSLVQAVLAAEESLVLKQAEMERNNREHTDRIALFRKLAANMRRNANMFRGNGVDLRINQLEGLQALASFLENEGHGNRIGYYRQPTGAGKTFLFGIITRLLDVKTLILVPRSNLREQTRDELVEAVGIPPESIQLIEPASKVMGSRICINTYQNHIWRMNNDPFYQKEVRASELVICDEAHKSLGRATQESIASLDGEFDEDMTEEDEHNQQEILEHIDQFTSQSALKLGFTATPELLEKSVEESYKVLISHSSYSELVKAKVIKKFKVMQVEVSIHPGEIAAGSIPLDKEIELLHRENVYRELLKAFKEAKENVDEDFYTLATCATIDECDVFSSVAEELKLRPIIVTNREYSRERNVDHKARAEKMLLDKEKDIIVTVDKLKEGWNFRPLNAVIIARASLSPANILQPAGRAARTYQNQKFAYIFEASWHPHELQNQSKPRGKRAVGSGGGTSAKRPPMNYRKPLTFAEALYMSGENDIDSVCESWTGEHLQFKRIFRWRTMSEKDRLAFITMAKSELSSKGYTNWMSIAYATAVEFCQIEFEGVGGSKALYAMMTGKSSNEISTSFSTAHLKEIADIVYPGSAEERTKEVRDFFAGQGYPDKDSFVYGNLVEFIAKQFGKFGKGLWMYNLVTGKQLRGLKSEHIKELANILYPTTPEDELTVFRSLLSQAGYPDRASMLNEDVRKFAVKNFGKIGKGTALYSAVTGKNAGTLNRSELIEMTNILYPTSTEKNMEYFRSLLSMHGYTDHWNLEFGGQRSFIGKQFGNIGKENSFYKAVTGKILGDAAPITNEHIKEIADILFPVTDQQRLDYFRSLAKNNGISTKEGLMAMTNRSFLSTDFGVIGKGRSFYIAVTGKAIEQWFEKKHLEELGDILFQH